MPTDLFSMIKSHYNTLTRAEKCIADYVLTNARDVLYMSITDLAKSCDVGDTSVFRFCRHLGKNGYQDFKVDLAQAIGDTKTSPAIENPVILSEDPVSVMIRKALMNTTAAMQETVQTIDAPELVTFAGHMKRAQHICFFPSEDTVEIAMQAKKRFLHVCPLVEVTLGSQMQLFRAALIRRGDCVVFFSPTGDSEEMLEAVRLLKKRGAYCALVSRYERSALSELCDFLMVYACNESAYQGGGTNARISQLFLMEALCLAYCHENPEEAEQCRGLTDALLESDWRGAIRL